MKMAQGPKFTPMSPDPTQRSGWGLGTRLALTMLFVKFKVLILISMTPVLASIMNRKLQSTLQYCDQVQTLLLCLSVRKKLKVREVSHPHFPDSTERIHIEVRNLSIQAVFIARVLYTYHLLLLSY